MKNCNPKLCKLGLWLLVFTMFDTTGIKAQKTFTIAECIFYAFQHNPLVNVGIADTSIAAVGVQRVKGLYLPRANFASAFQYFSNRIGSRGKSN